MVNKLSMFVFVSLMIISLPCLSLAQEDLEYGYGTVNKVDTSSNTIVLSEYDYDSDSEIIATYSVTADTKFDGVSALKEIEIGEDVDIEYVVDSAGRKVAVSISVYETE